MTPHDDPTENLITRTLDDHAADAPSDAGLLTGVHTRLRRRRNTRVLGAAVLACAAVATTVTAGQSLNSEVTPAREPVAPQTFPAARTQSNAGLSLRWESYKTVQVQVPASWKTYVSGPAPCSVSSGPVIGRLSPWLDRQRGCALAVLPLADRQEYLWFDDVQKPGVKQYDGGWTEETREVAGVHVSVLSKSDTTRREILDSATPILKTDKYGCTPRMGGDQAFAESASLPARDAALQAVSTVSICEYWGGGVSPVQGTTLLAGSRLTGSEARAFAVELTDSTPDSTTPGSLPGCTDDGGRTFVMTVTSPVANWPSRLHYSPCFTSYRIGEGSTQRTASQNLVDRLRTGVHRPSQPTDLILIPNNKTTPAR
ncbi:hypothetical protein ACFPJ1_36805 [Kribbella qitaiheensis]|uniref:hypothetical protein n=1 Tax=Kribbella qitaiheensis TaxID=1544730 RepID=UPI00360B257E